MQKINFQNLPSTTTPINATNLNAIQSNAEDAINDLSNYVDGTNTMGNIIVESISTKNMFNSDSPSVIHSGMTWTGSGKSHYLTSTISFGGGMRWYFEAKAGEKYTFSYKQRNNNNIYLYIREKQTPDWSGTTLKSIVNDGTGTSYSFTIVNDCYLEITFQTGAAVTNVLFEELQLERGLTKTNYTPYQELNNHEYYTTGEQAIGTWIDGKTLYRRCFEIPQTTISSSSTTAIGIPTGNVNMVNIGGYVFVGNSQYRYPIIGFRTLDYGVRNLSNGTQLLVGTSLSIEGTIKGVAIIDYTKP